MDYVQSKHWDFHFLLDMSQLRGDLVLSGGIVMWLCFSHPDYFAGVTTLSHVQH
jgi:hypothetical protein